MTYGELWQEVDRAARAFLRTECARATASGSGRPNRYEWVVTQFATARIGAILVTINPAYKATEVEYALNKTGVSLLVMSRGFRQSDYAAMLAEVRARCPELRTAIVLEDDWDAFLAEAGHVEDHELAERERMLRCDDAINIQYTSGTTGHPKAATFSHHNILNNGFFVGEGARVTERDRICVPVPFYHCFGMVMGNLAATSHGACVVVPAEAFEAGAVLDAVQAERCTVLYGVPTMFIAELDQRDFDSYDLSSLRTGIMAGSPCPVDVMRKVVDTDAHVRGDHLLWHDGDLSDLDADRCRRRSRAPHDDGRERPPARGDPRRRPRDGADPGARRDR